MILYFACFACFWLGSIFGHYTSRLQRDYREARQQSPDIPTSNIPVCTPDRGDPITARYSREYELDRATIQRWAAEYTTRQLAQERRECINLPELDRIEFVGRN